MFSVRLSGIVGMTDAEGEAVLAALFAHVTGSRFVCRHRWRVGDLLIRGNCAVQHKAVADYALPRRRLMERTTLSGGAAC
jgi:taurine dioxygenase